MAIHEPLNAYRATAVHTTSPAGLIEMLYQGAVRELRQAGQSLEDGQGAQARPHLRKAQEIVSVLRSALRPQESTADMVARLDAIYDFAYWRLADAYARDDADACRDALDVLLPLRDAWSEAFGTAPALAAGQGAAARG